MAILNLGLSGITKATSSTNGYRVYESQDAVVGTAGHNIRIVWSTEYGSDVQEEFIFTIYWRAWERGKSVRTAWSDAITATIKPSQCSEYQPHANGRVWWSHDLDIGNLLSQIADSNGAFRYDTRLYDSIDLDISLYSKWWLKNSLKKSEVARRTCYIGHIPQYSITSVYYEESDLMVIEYDTTWERKDDRYAFEELYVTGYGSVFDHIDDETFSDIIYIEDESAKPASVLKGNTWGYITAPGRIEVATSKLTQHLKGRSVYIDIRFNASYRPIELDFSNARGYFEVEDRTICNTPTLSLGTSNDSYSIAVRTGDSGDLDAPAEKVTVKLFGGKYSADEVTVTPGETATLRFCPLNTSLVVEAIASRGKATSKSVSIYAGKITTTGIAILESIADKSSRAILEWNQNYDITTAPNFETIKLAGRRRPSAFYGAGGHTSVSAQAVLIDESGLSVEQMPELGDVMLRIHNGRRYALVLEAQVSWTVADGPRIKTVSISGEEVDA